MRTPAFALVIGAMLGGCTTAPDTTGYDSFSNLRAASSFCERYALLTGRNAYENARNSNEGSSALNALGAKRAEERALARCRAGRTN